jgi:hypothetical protein
MKKGQVEILTWLGTLAIVQKRGVGTPQGRIMLVQ